MTYSCALLPPVRVYWNSMIGGQNTEGAPASASEAADLRRALSRWNSGLGAGASLGLSLDSTVHRLNNPLAALLILLEELCEQMLKVMPCEEQLEALRMIQEARAQGARLAEAMRELSALSPHDPPGPTDLRPILVGLAALIERQGRDLIRVSQQFVGDLSLESREVRLSQLLWTAAQVLLDLPGEQADGACRELSMEATQGDGIVEVELRRTDLSGVSQAERPPHDRRFDLLSATVHQLGGSLRTGDERIELTFPIRAAAFDSEAEVRLARRSSVPPRGEMRILVVDDDPGIHRALSRSLRELGDVQAVTSATTARDLLSGGAMFDVILSDLIMPESSGLELARWLAAHRPRLRRRLILMTGMGEPSLDHEPDTIAVPKPFDMEALRELVCQVAARG